jgi:hypothetical protein
VDIKPPKLTHEYLALCESVSTRLSSPPPPFHSIEAFEFNYAKMCKCLPYFANVFIPDLKNKLRMSQKESNPLHSVATQGQPLTQLAAAVDSCQMYVDVWMSKNFACRLKDVVHLQEIFILILRHLYLWFISRKTTKANEMNRAYSTRVVDMHMKFWLENLRRSFGWL